MGSPLDYLLENETVVVFDIDGVLAPYEFGELCHCIAPDEEWDRISREEDAYALVGPVPLLQRFVAEKGVDKVYACSVAMDYEVANKRRFVVEHYGLAEDHCRFVESKADKTAYLLKLADVLDLPQSRIAIVEDTVKTLDALVRGGYGFVTVHVSSLFAYAEQ